MNPDVWGWIGGGAVALLATVWSTLLSRRATQAKARLDEVSAYSVLVGDLRQQVDRLQEDLTELRRLLSTTQTDNEALRAQITQQTRQIARLQATVDRLTALLTEHKIPLPSDA